MSAEGEFTMVPQRDAPPHGADAKSALPTTMTQNERWNRAGKEPYPFHPQASHVDPAYRDGWNAELKAVASQPLAPPAEPTISVARAGEICMAGSDGTTSTADDAGFYDAAHRRCAGSAPGISAGRLR